MTILQLTITAGVVAFIAVATLTTVMRKLAVRRRLVDRPRPGRVHTSATPYLGGVAIVIGTLGTTAALAYPSTLQLRSVIFAATAVSLLGLTDDLWLLSPMIRLIAECLAAIALVVTGVHVDVFAGVPTIGYWIDDIGTVIWIVVITNSFNLLDNTDGVAATVAFVTSPILAILAFAAGQPELAILLIALCAGCAGFLVHNWTPAQIFMGDSGSLFIGFIISACAVLTCVSGEANQLPPISVVASGLLLMTFVAVVDTCTVLVSRLRTGRRWSEGGTDHLAHRLRFMGLSTSRTAAAVAVTTAASATLGLMVISDVVPARGSLAVTLAVGVILVALAQTVQVYPGQDTNIHDQPSEVMTTAIPGSQASLDPVIAERADKPIRPGVETGSLSPEPSSSAALSTLPGRSSLNARLAK